MTDSEPAAELDPPQRLLCGPGPTNVAPSVLAAMQKPMLGHLDPDLHEILLEVVDAAARRSTGRPTGSCCRCRRPASSGMEAGILEPGRAAARP